MSEVKHTPGPWFVNMDDLVGDGKKVIDANGRSVGWTSAVRNIKGRVIDDPIEAKEALSNARLIAAAPDMLEALKDARFHLYGNGPGNPKIDAAIAKAEGRS